MNKGLAGAGYQILLALTTDGIMVSWELVATICNQNLQPPHWFRGGLPWQHPETTFEKHHYCRKFATITADHDGKPRQSTVKGIAMKLLRFIPAMLMALSVSACMQSEAPSRNLTLPAGDITSGGTSSTPSVPAKGGQIVLTSQFNVAAINVIVPRSLKSSEANSFRPNADIVWRGEALGDRHVQVARIFNAAMTTGTAGMVSGRAVALDIEVARFHCLTEKTRFTVGGVHSLQFLLTVRDAATGEILQPARLVVADIKAAGGTKALAEDSSGRTQLVVVQERLAEVIRRELSVPVSTQADVAVVSQFDGSPLAIATPAALANSVIQ